MSQFEVVVTREGARAILDRETGEVMHPVVGPAIEAHALYVEPSRLEGRLAACPLDTVLTIFDVGLGAGSNAIAAWQCSENRSGGATLQIISFDQTTEALELALEHPESFSLTGDAGQAAREVVQSSVSERPRTRWQFIRGSLPGSLGGADTLANIVFWDPYSPKANPSLWTTEAFSRLKPFCAADATLHTYSAATSTRSALLLAGFAVGLGSATGSKGQTTVAAMDMRALDDPLNERWLERLGRSSVPLPSDAPDAAFDLIRTRPQFNHG